MKSKNGFTLIELMAVVLILAIIVTITTPLVFGYIEDSKKETAKVSAKEYLKAIEQNNMTAKIDKNSSIIESGDVEDINKQIKIRGDKPTSGQVIIDNSTVNLAALCINDYLVSYTEEDMKVGNKCNEINLFGGNIVKPVEKRTYKAIIYLDPENLMNKCDEKIYKENIEKFDTDIMLTGNVKSPTGLKNGCMKWYLYNENEDNYLLLLDHNIGSEVTWNAEAGCDKGTMTSVGPKIKELTDSWSSVLKLNKKIDNYNYEDYKARLITANEVAEVVGAADENTIGWDSNKLHTFHDYEASWSYTGILDEYEKKYIDEIIVKRPTPDVYYSFWRDNENSKYNFESNWLFDHTSIGCSLVDYDDCVADETAPGYWTSSTSHLLGNYNYGTNENPLYLPTPYPYEIWVVTSGWLDTSYLNHSATFGIRPVIEVPKIFFDIN